MLSRVLPQRFNKVAYTFLLSIGLPAFALSFDNIDFCSWTISTCIVSESDIEHLEWPNHFKCDGAELGAERLSPTISLENINPGGLVPDHLEIAALRNLYDSTNGANWTNNTGWPSTPAAWDTILTVSQIVDWYGLTISNDDIKKVGLPGNGLTGNIPASLSNLAGLRELILDDNQLSGTIPASLGDLELLSFLYLHANNLVGTIPPELGKLNQLSHLYLYSNSLTGGIPPELGNMSALVYLHVAHNQLSGDIPFELSGLNNLEALALNYNLFETVLPDWLGSLPSLKIVILSGNDFYGALPRSFTSSATLVSIFAENNQLTHFPDFSSHPNPGAVTINIANNYIPQADIDANMVGGQPIFAAFTYAPQKEVPVGQGQVLDLVEISSLKDFYESTGGSNWTDNTGWPATPAEWEDITSIDQAATWFGVTVENGDISALVMENNGLAGDLPESLYLLRVLSNLSLVTNALTGTLSPLIGNLTELTVLNLASNDLNGELPSTLSRLSKLITLSLMDNAFSGPLNGVDFSTMGSLKNLYLQVNQFTGTIPSTLEACPLLRVVLFSNQLSGKIPAFLFNKSSLLVLSLGNNQLTGAIPSNFEQLVQLSDLSLLDNNFTSFPNLSSHPNAPNLRVSIPNNYIPWDDIAANLNADSTHSFESFDYAPQLEVPAGQGQVLDIAEIASLRDLYEYTHGANWTDNTGWPSTPTEWEAITSIDQAATWFGVTVENGDVANIFLNSNGLSGSLPQTIGNLSELKRFWVNVNSLYGELPASIYSLNKLTQLNLAANDFTGPLDPRIGGMDALGLLRIGGNEFDVPLPIEIGNLENLWSLTINEIALNSEIPGWVSSLGNLSELSMKNCGLTGRIPGSFSNLVNLKLLFLGRNNLEGEIPDFTGLTQLEMLDLELNSNLSGDLSEKFSVLDNFTMFSVHTNLFTGLPDFSNIPTPGDLSIEAYRNLFSFGSIEANLNPDGTHSYRSFGYDPQNAPQEISVIQTLINEPISLWNNRGDGVNTSYQWQEWDGTQWLDVVGETSASLSLDTISIQDDGKLFRCEMTNSLITGMTLYSQKTEIQVIIPLTFYVISDGDWSDPTAWSLTDGGPPENKVPTRYDEVRIKDFQVEVTSQVDCRELNISAGPRTRVVVSGKDARLTINGDVVIHNLDARDNEVLQVMNQGKLECK